MVSFQPPTDTSSKKKKKIRKANDNNTFNLNP